MPCAPGGCIAPITYEDGTDGPHRVWLRDEEVPGLAMSRSVGDTIGKIAGVCSEAEITEVRSGRAPHQTKPMHTTLDQSAPFSLALLRWVFLEIHSCNWWKRTSASSSPQTGCGSSLPTKPLGTLCTTSALSMLQMRCVPGGGSLQGLRWCVRSGYYECDPHGVPITL